MRLWQGAGLDGFDALHAPDFVDHSASGRATDRDGFRTGIADLYRAFPDFSASVDAIVIDDARALVAIRWSAVGHMQGGFLGASPTGRRVTFHGIEIIAIREARVTERWGEWDETAIRRQIGSSNPQRLDEKAQKIGVSPNSSK
ncbi:MAG TPA: ester cyclase [Stellaceae bacterium]|nr:ester cyclase [Stellaceae bacterium]